MPNDITMTEITSPSKIWKVGYTVDAAGTKTKNLITSGTFLDRNIGVEIITPAISGSIGGSASAGSTTASITNVDSISATTTTPSGTAGTDYWRIKATATGTAGFYTPKYTVTNAGWLASTVNGSAQTVNVTSDTTGKFLYIPKATVGGSGGNISVTSAGYLPEGTELASMNTAAATVSASKQATSPTIARTTNSVSGKTNVANGDATTNTSSLGTYFVSVKATAPATTLDITKTIITAGYLNSNTQITASAATTSKEGSVYYIPIASGSPAFDGGAISGSVTSIDSANVTLSDTNNGIYVQGNASAGRADVLYNGAVNGYVSISDNTVALAGTSSNTSLTSLKKYITAITVPKDKPFSVTTTADTTLDSTSNLTITNNAYRQVVITNNAHGDINVNNKGQVDISQTAVSGGVTINAYNNASTAALTGAQTVVTGGKWKYNTVTPPVTGNATTYYGATIVNPMSSGTAAAATVTASKEATAPTIAKTSTTVSGATNVANGNATTTAPSSGCFVSIQATAPVTNLDIIKTVDTAGYLGANTQISVSASTTAKTGSIYYVPVASTSISQGTTSVSGTTATRGTASWNSGWLSSGSISAATFANTATSGVSYVDISGTTAAPVLVSGNYLYINKGYTDNLKISLAKLVPDGASADLADGHILSGYSAYNNDGALIAGSIATRTLPTTMASSATSGYSSITTVSRSTSDQYINIQSGYYANNSYYKINAVANGSATTPTTTITKNPTISINSSGLITASYSGSQSITPTVVAGYVSSGTAGTVSTSGSNTKQLTTQAAQTIYPSSSDQTIAASTYLTGIQTFKAVALTNISAENIKYGTTVKVGDSVDDDRVTAVTGTFTSASTVSTGQTAASANKILNGYSAWVDGVEVQGSIANGSGITFNGKTATAGAGYYSSNTTADMNLASITSGTATINSVSYTYNSSSGNFTISGSANVSAPTVGTAGYISSSEGTKNAKSGGATLSATVAKIGVSAAMTGTAKVTPTISKITTASGNSATNITAAVSAATTTKPTSGYYIAVQSAASANDITATPSVSTAGYGTTSYYSASTSTLSVGANASSVTYFPVTTASISSEGSVTTAPSVTIGGTTNMATANSGTYYFTRTGTVSNGTVQTKWKNATAGYAAQNTSGTNSGTVTVTPTKTDDATIYIPTAQGSITMSAGSGSCTLQSSSNIDLSDSDTTSGVSVTFRGSGSVSATAKITTAGYTPTNNSFATGSSTSSNTTDLTKYITGVELTKGKSFSIRVPNGPLNSDGTNNNTITFVFTVANNNTGNVTVAEV